MIDTLINLGILLQLCLIYACLRRVTDELLPLWRGRGKLVYDWRKERDK